MSDLVTGKLAIVMLSTKALWAIVRSTNAMSEKFCNELTWAKEELCRRGFVVAGETSAAAPRCQHGQKTTERCNDCR